jgi:hypothetical protein
VTFMGGDLVTRFLSANAPGIAKILCVILFTTLKGLLCPVVTPDIATPSLLWDLFSVICNHC